MALLSNGEIVTNTVLMINEKASSVAKEELSKYEKEHTNALIEQDLRELVLQRAGSELMLRMCNFKPGTEIDLDTLKERFENWFVTEEEARLRQMCVSAISEELKKRAKPGDENLTFTDKFLRSVKERGKSMNTVNLMQDLNKD